MPKYRYDVGAQILESLEDGKRKIIAERMINSYDNLDDAINCLLKNAYLNDKFINITKEDVIEDIDCSQELFDKGWPYRILMNNINYCAQNSTYNGMGAYTIEKVSLQ